MVKEVNASHILVKTEEQAKIALYDVKNGKTFEDVAKAVSLCPSKKNGGNLGWFTRGRMVKEFDDVCFKSKKDDIIGPVKTQFGFHIIKINNTR